uniref:Variant surface glycoprotein 1125.1350 n=1 Tax=Trypanosoma brucei TaxID=5691 RepID=A0A1J0R729_9TRYP|nr:variant surface glycoprotein 1125.1350 [Trypanosoma brucei]
MIGTSGSLTLIIALPDVTRRAKGNFEHNINGAEAAALCNIVSCAGKRSKLAAQKPPETTDHSDILKLDMSVADESWRRIFVNNSTPPKANPFDASTGGSNRDWREQWPTWAATAAKVEHQGALDVLLTKLKLNKIPLEKLQNKRSLIQALAVEASSIVEATKGAAPDDSILTDDQLQAAINKAVYEAETETTGAGLGKGQISQTSVDTRQNMCKGAKSGSKVQAILGTLACLCLPDSTSNGEDQGKACTAKTALANNWNLNNGAPAQTPIEDLQKLCDRQTEHKLAAAEIKNAAERLGQLIKYDATNGYLGIHKVTAYSANDGQGMCVEYTGIGNTAGKPTDVITWLGELYNLAQRVAVHEEAVTKRKQAQYEKAVRDRLVPHLIYTDSPPSVKTGKE